MSYIFVSIPYTGTQEQKLTRYETVAKYVAKLMKQGLNAYSPVAYGHPIAQITDLPIDFGFWREHCFVFINRCKELHVLMIPGWQESVGVQEEIELAELLDKPIKYIKI